MNTTKICNFKNCLKTSSPSLPINPCQYYKNTDTGNWHHEMTAAKAVGTAIYEGKVRSFQQILDMLFHEAVIKWENKQEVHEEIDVIYPRNIVKPEAKLETPIAEIEEAVNWWSRNKHKRKSIIHKVKVLGATIHSLEMFRRKFAIKKGINEQIEKVRMERDLLIREQSQLDKKFAKYKRFIKEDEQWAEKWITKRSTRATEIVLLYSPNDNDIFEINRHGLRKNMEYVHCPLMDNQREECLAYAEKNLFIPRGAWIETRIEQEFVGKPIKHFGKKNANGGRIRSRADQRKYEQHVKDIIRELRAAGMKIEDLALDPDLKVKYETHIKKKISGLTD